METAPFYLTCDLVTLSLESYIGVFISVGIICITFITCITCFYKCSKDLIDKVQKRLTERAERLELLAAAQEIPLRYNSPRRNLESMSRRERQQNLIKDNKEILGKMYDEELEPKLFSKTMDKFCENCTICLEDLRLSRLF